ncbi:MAG TPA: FAD-dependent oxidoreductase [Hyphomicrobium sp.]|nr:FAD-dependent oxidoreductase [Hyphomicrobium sp.]
MSSLPTIAIIGGGLSGAAVAYHLAERSAAAAITVFEPRDTLGAGLAYGTSDPAHRINVPAAKMSLIPGDDRHFIDWVGRTDAVSDDPEALAADGNLYVRRSVFGRYVYEHLQPWIANGRIAHAKANVNSIERNGGRWRIRTSTGLSTFADILVVATTHPLPEVPRVLAQALKGMSRLIANPYDPEALEGVPLDARVTIIGAGLTMADVVASLDRRGHRGPITAISRRGLLPRGHAQQTYQLFGEFARTPPLSTVELLREIRRTIERAQARGVPWQAVIDAVRAQAGLFWPAMPIEERSRLVRHLRPFWDAHRFRIAPQIQNILSRRASEGTFLLSPGTIKGAEAHNDRIDLDVLARRASSPTRHEADYVVITTGPAHGSIIETESHLSTLAQSGWIQADRLGLGILCNVHGRSISRSGDIVEDLLIAGPLARGTFGELMGLPQVTDYALAIAGEVLNELASRHPARPSAARMIANAN